MSKKTVYLRLVLQVCVAVGVTWVVFAHPTYAQTTFDVSVIAGSCANCHGTDGRSPGGIPSLAGRPASVLKAQMLAFQSEQSPAGTTIMNRLAKGYSEAEVDALAIYFSQISPEAPVESVSPTATSKEAK